MATEDIELRLLDAAVRLEEVEAEQVEAADARTPVTETARALGHLATPEADQTPTHTTSAGEPVETIRVYRRV